MISIWSTYVMNYDSYHTFSISNRTASIHHTLLIVVHMCTHTHIYVFMYYDYVSILYFILLYHIYALGHITPTFYHYKMIMDTTATQHILYYKYSYSISTHTHTHACAHAGTNMTWHDITADSFHHEVEETTKPLSVLRVQWHTGSYRKSYWLYYMC